MATATVDLCAVCTHSFNSSSRRSVPLPCGHNFCLSCLVRLKASGNPQCPTCRRNCAGFDVPAMPEMETLAAALPADQEDEEGNMTNKKGLSYRCEEHSMPYDYWVTGTTDFFCRRCAKENHHVDIELIEDAIPEIKEVLAAKIPNAMEKVESDLESLDEMHALFVRKRNLVHAFVKEAMALDDNIKSNIEQIAASRSQLLNTAAQMKGMQKKIHTIMNTSDINLAVECKSTLDKVVRPLTLPSTDLPRSLLYNIACSYMEEAATATPPSRASFVNAMLKGSSVGPLTEAAWAAKPSPETIAAAEKLEGGKPWIVDHNNCDAVLLALADKQPSELSLITWDDDCKALPVAEVARAAKGCKVTAIFRDTFYSADNSATDAARLAHLTANQSLRLFCFFGHLDHSSIAKLPHTLAGLRLAIGSAAGAAAVSSLRPWKGLYWLGVAVSSRVAAKDLKPMPDAQFKYIYFPYRSDAGVDSVRPAIEALAPNLRISWLLFPKSQLTAAGVRHLAQQLRGVTIRYSVIIEANGSWQPGAEEKKGVEAEMRGATGCDCVKWTSDGI